jgi:hypothetical protein
LLIFGGVRMRFLVCQDSCEDQERFEHGQVGATTEADNLPIPFSPMVNWSPLWDAVVFRAAAGFSSTLLFEDLHSLARPLDQPARIQPAPPLPFFYIHQHYAKKA